MRTRTAHLASALVTCAALLAPALAAAQAPVVKQEFAKPEEVKDVVWKADGQLGTLFTYGNANVFNISGGVKATRTDPKNRILLEAVGAYGRTRLPTDINSNGSLDTQDELDGQWQDTVANALAKFRYDRFFTPNNTLYLSVSGGSEYLAGKAGIVSAQIGYMRQLVKNEKHALSLEAGLDYNFAYFVQKPAMGDQFVNIAAARLFLGYGLTINDKVNWDVSAETFINFNSVRIADFDRGFAEASRFIGKTALTAKLSGRVSFKFGFTAKYENAPAARPAPKIPLNALFVLTPEQKLANRYDLITEAALIVSFM